MFTLTHTITGRDCGSLHTFIDAIRLRSELLAIFGAQHGRYTITFRSL